MYICICNAITDKTINAAIDAGARTLRELSAQTGVATNCGKCATEAQRLLDLATTDQYKAAGSKAERISPPALSVVA